MTSKNSDENGVSYEYQNPTDAGFAITRDYIEFMESVAAPTLSGTRAGKLLKWTDWFDTAGAAGSVLSLIKTQKDGMGKLTISLRNDTPHVMIPFGIQLPSILYACNATFVPTKPGDTCEIELDIYPLPVGNDVSPIGMFFVQVAFCSCNGKYTKGWFRLDSDDGSTFCPGTVWMEKYGKAANFHNKDASSSERNVLGYVIMSGKNGYPSFGMASMKVPTKTKGDMSTVGVTFTPRGDPIIPSDETFTAHWQLDTPEKYEDSGLGCCEFGLMVWNHLRRIEEEEELPTRIVGLILGAIQGGISLLTGALNLARSNNKEHHHLVLNMKNYTKHIMVVTEVSNTNECVTDFPVIYPDSEGSITLGSKYYEGTDRGPQVVFTMTSPELKGIKVMVELVNTFKQYSIPNYSMFMAGQMRVLSLTVDDKTVTDEEGKTAESRILEATVWKSPKQDDGKPQFSMMGFPTSSINSDFTLAFVD